MRSQVPLVTASLAREHSSYDANGPRRRHLSEADRLRAELAAVRESRAALVEAYLRVTGRAA